ncbi:MAG TPA: hypothetical protein VJT50_03680 [Pyrinomonadaceae bacterium]|nr:hypothetical protein [Pyrinomonadaceae bacterium]
MKRNKCPQCGLINVASDENCRRCNASLIEAPDEVIDAGDPQPPRRTLGKRIIWILGTTLVLLFVFYMSLRISSDDLDYQHREIVMQSVEVLNRQGFSREAFVLKHLTTYRSSENWWNRFIGHREAYAATNFPFEVLTLYPQFFNVPLDENERAAILLHEAYHLLGSGELAALERVWRNKQQLGWTEDRYGGTAVWRITKGLTMDGVPQLFQCGTDHASDCTATSKYSF